MDYEITLQVASSLTLAAVRKTGPASGIATAWKPALDHVWSFLRTNQTPNSGLNVFLYHHPHRPGGAMTVDFGVQILEPFADEGGITCVATPSGEVAQTVHVGPYDRLNDAHAAIHRWCRQNQRTSAVSWEIYGHWNQDPTKLETTIRYLLS